jgi:hypothetical protein
MAVRYEGSGELDLEIVDEILAEGNSAPLMGVLSDLLAWNASDPVDAFEMNRNEVIYDFQGNRNPFVDHPELAEHLWGVWQGQPWPLALDTDASADLDALRLYPNPARDAVRLNQPFEQAEVYDLQGRNVLHWSGPEALDITNLPDGMYLVQVARKGLKPGVLKLVVH